MGDTENKKGKVLFRESFAYAIGGGSVNLMGVSILGVLLVYYTYVVGISAGVAATVLGISRMFDGISDIIMGRIIDRTNSRFGKARPWLIRMIIPMIISLLACFCVPANWNTMAQAVYMFITYNLACSVCGTALGVANGALNGFMTLDQKTRGLNGALSMIMNSVTNMVFAATYLRMALYFGGGEQYSNKGWFITVSIYCVIYIPLALIGFFGTKERVTSGQETLDESDNIPDAAKEKTSLLDSFKLLISNKYWIITLVVCFFIYFIMSISSSTTVYFCDYILGDVNHQALMSVLSAVGILPGVLISLPLMSKRGKRLPILVGMGTYIVISALPIINMSVSTFAIACAFRGIGMGIAVAPMGSFVHDALTYGLWKSKVNCTGVGSSASGMALKLGSALSSVATGVLLEIGGFVSGGGAQPDSAIFMINGMCIWIPVIFAVIVILVLIPYDLDKKYGSIVSDLEQGKYAD